MTREEVKELLPVMQAFIEGKTIECRTKTWEYNKGWQYSTNWRKTEQLIFRDTFEYRIKPEPKYRPFKTKEECWNEMMKHQPFGWVKEISTEMLYLINGMTNTSIVTMENINSFEEAINIYKFKDGEPFGIKE